MGKAGNGYDRAHRINQINQTNQINQIKRANGIEQKSPPTVGPSGRPEQCGGMENRCGHIGRHGRMKNRPGPRSIGRRAALAAVMAAFVAGMAAAAFDLPAVISAVAPSRTQDGPQLAGQQDQTQAGRAWEKLSAGLQAEQQGKMRDSMAGLQAEAVKTAATAPDISASGAILIDGRNGMVLYERNADEKLYPASTTKIMTALVTLEICEELNVDLQSQVVVPREAQGVEGSSLYLKAGEHVTLEELLYGLMLHSGNDSAVTLASCMGGKQQIFIDRMNRKAKELGCMGTHFTNPNGLFDEDHYTTARDLSAIAMEAMKYEEFREIVASKKWSEPTPDEADVPEEADAPGVVNVPDETDVPNGADMPDETDTRRSFVNKNKTVFQYEGGNGIKIGYTKASGRTLVASARRGNVQLIAVVLRDPNWFQDAYGLMDFGFELLKGGED